MQQNTIDTKNSFTYFSFTMSFGAYLIWFELHRSATYEPKTYLNIICELGLGVHLAFLHLLEVDQFGPEAQYILGQ